MNTQLQTPRSRRANGIIALVVSAVLGIPSIPVSAAEGLSDAVKSQIEALVAEKESRTPAQKKISSTLLWVSREVKGKAMAAGVTFARPARASVSMDAKDRVEVDITGTVAPGLLNAIKQGGGTVAASVQQFNSIRAWVSPAALEALAARPDVRAIEPAQQPETNVGSLTTEGDTTHRSGILRSAYGASGTGITVGVLSDGVNSLALSKASGDLNAGATFLAGQAGAGDEGTAMMEIVQDIVPNATVIFATGFGGQASMAANILALQAAGCRVIVDDVTYGNESPFQDGHATSSAGVISNAVTAVSSAGVLYFSSAANSGNLADGTACTWEGDWNDSGVAAAAPLTTAGNLHSFGAANFNTVTSLGNSRNVNLFWSDPLQGSGNDYDLFLTDSTGTVLKGFSTNTQTGTQDPFEAINGTSAGIAVGDRIYVVKSAGAAARYLHLNNSRCRLSISTAGNTHGHNAAGAANAFSVAAAPCNVASGAGPTGPFPGVYSGTQLSETFTSDGPRRYFFNAAGVAYTPGNFSSTGGLLLSKPDLTAADGCVTTVGGFNPFFGTSAAAPHAAGIAALLLSYKPTLTAAQVRTALTSTAIDIEAPGWDAATGAGIIDAQAALAATSPVVVSKQYVSEPSIPSGSVVHFDEIPVGTAINGQTIKGFTFTENSPTAVTSNDGPGSTNNVTIPTCGTPSTPINPATYVLTITMPGTVKALGFGFATVPQVLTPGAVTVTLFNGATNLGSLSFTGAPDPTFAGGFVGIGHVGGFTSARITFGPNLFVIDNVAASNSLPPSFPQVVTSSLGSVITGEFAPNAAGANDGTKFDVLKRGGYLAENGNLVFPSYLLVGSGGVTLSPNNYMGLWKQVGSGLTLFARSANGAPETGATAAKWDVMPQTPAINDSGEVTFLASLAVSGASTPPTTVNNDTGLWSELGGTGLGILMREGDTIPPLTPLQIGAFASGAFATARTGATTGEAAFAVTMKNGSTDTAILRASVTGPAVTTVGVVARQNTAMPGVAGEQFGNLAGNYTDSIRMDATGNLTFVALSVSNRESIWYQPIAGGSPVKAFIAGTAATGDTAPNTGGATFKNIKSPSIGSAGTIAFRGLLNNNGDNAAGLKNDGIWRGTTGAGFTCILRRGDDNTNRAGLGLGVGAKVGNVWSGWLTNANHTALRAWVDLNGDGSSAAPADVQGIFTDLSGTMSIMTKVGDASPGIAGATFASVDLPVVGGVEQCAFLGTVTGGGTTAANNKGVWRCGANGGTLNLVLRTGDTMSTTQGTKTIANVDFPGSNTTDRRWEQHVMDATGRLIVYVTFIGGATAQVLVP